MSQRETILAAVAATLVTANVASGRVYRTRREQLPTLPAVIVEPRGELAEEAVIGMSDAELSVAVAVYARGDIPDQAADTTLAAVHAALMATPQLGLGSDVMVMPKRDINWDVEEYDTARVTLNYTINYRTAIGAM